MNYKGVNWTTDLIGTQAGKGCLGNLNIWNGRNGCVTPNPRERGRTIIRGRRIRSLGQEDSIQGL